MKDNQSACFEVEKVEYEYTTDYVGYIGVKDKQRAIWMSTSATQSAYCFSEDSVSKGIIAKFRVKQLNNNQDAI